MSGTNKAVQSYRKEETLDASRRGTVLGQPCSKNKGQITAQLIFFFWGGGGGLSENPVFS